MAARSTASTWDLRSSGPEGAPFGAVEVPFRQSEVLAVEQPAGGQHRRALDRVPELAHVAGPAVVRQRGQRRRGDAHRMTQPLGGLPGEVGEQRRDVLRPLAERRNVEPDDVEPVVEVGAELAAAPPPAPAAWPVAARTRTSIFLDSRPPSRRISPSSSTRSSLACSAERQVADLVEQQGAAVGQLEQAGLVGGGAGEGALACDRTARTRAAAPGWRRS